MQTYSKVVLGSMDRFYRRSPCTGFCAAESGKVLTLSNRAGIDRNKLRGDNGGTESDSAPIALAIVPAGQRDSIDVCVTHESNVILDINGYFSAQ